MMYYKFKVPLFAIKINNIFRKLFGNNVSTIIQVITVYFELKTLFKSYVFKLLIDKISKIILFFDTIYITIKY